MQFQQRLRNLTTEKNNQKDAMYFYPEDNHKWRIAKREKSKKKDGFKHELNYFSLNFLRLSEDVETLGINRWSKKLYKAISREDFRETHTILAYCFTNSLFSLVYSSVDRWCLNSKLFTGVSFNYGSFFQTEIISDLNGIQFQPILTSYATFEEEKIFYLRKCV